MSQSLRLRASASDPCTPVPVGGKRAGHVRIERSTKAPWTDPSSSAVLQTIGWLLHGAAMCSTGRPLPVQRPCAAWLKSRSVNALRQQNPTPSHLEQQPDNTERQTPLRSALHCAANAAAPRTRVVSGALLRGAREALRLNVRDDRDRPQGGHVVDHPDAVDFVDVVAHRWPQVVGRGGRALCSWPPRPASRWSSPRARWRPSACRPVAAEPVELPRVGTLTVPIRWLHPMDAPVSPGHHDASLRGI